MKTKLKVGIIGAGGIAQGAHIPSFQKNPHVELAAIMDSNREKAEWVADKTGIPKAFGDVEELLREDIDIAVICSPNAFHVEHAVAALKSGKHVLCEKPLCLCRQDAEKVFETADSAGRKFMVGFPRRFTGETEVLKNMIRNGDFGDIYHVKVSYLRRRGIPGLGTWFTSRKLAGGGPMIDCGVHMLDWAIYLLGGPQPEMVVGVTHAKFRDCAVDGGWPPPESRRGDATDGVFDVEDLAAGFIRLSGGISLFAEASWAGNSETGQRLSIFGTKAGAQLPDPENPKHIMKIYSEMGGVTTDVVPSVRNIPSFQAEVDHFVDCIRQDRAPLTTREEILSVVTIIEALYRSAETGKPVVLS